MSLYCDDCGFAIDPQCMCKIPGKAERTTRELPVHDAGPYREPSTGRVMTSHAACSHESSKAARAACRKARAASN